MGGEANRWLLVGGVFFIILACGVLVKMQIDNKGKGGLSDAIKKVVLNYLQMAALAQGFPLQWPAAVESLFAIQSTVSTAGQYMLRPDCELSSFQAADAFYRKMVIFSCAPPLVILMSGLFFWCFAKCRHPRLACTLNCRCKTCSTRKCCSTGPISWRKREKDDYSPKDMTVCAIVVLLYMLYPTMLLQVFSMLACKKVGGARYLSADLQEKCFEGQHLLWVLVLCLPQLIFYVFLIPIVGVYFLKRNKMELWTKRVVMFRYGLLYNGYSEKHYYWEANMAVRKASIVALGVFGSLMGVEPQTHMGLAILMLFLVIHLAASPYDAKIDPKGILHKLDTTSLVIIWSTLWSGLLF